MSRSFWPARQATPWWEDPPPRWHLISVGLYLAPMLLAAAMVREGYDGPTVAASVAALATASSYAVVRIIRNYRGR